MVQDGAASQAALDMLARQITAAKAILARQAPEEQPIAPRQRWERAMRWRESTTTLLTRYISPDEATRFSRIGYMVPGGQAEDRATRDWLHRQVPFLEELARELEQQPEAIFPEAAPLRPGDVRLTREGILVRNQTFDAFQLVRGLVLEARTSVEVIDAYVDEQTLARLTPSQPTVSVDILTAPPRPGQSHKPALLAAARAMKGQYPGLEIREAAGFHDRFLIIDSREYFHFGASLKDLGKATFMFSKLEEDVARRALRAEWDRLWPAAAVVI